LRGIANVVLSVALYICAVELGHAIASTVNDGAIKIAQTDIEEDV
jgi:hypothetical protein